MQIRKATESDLKDILSVENKAFGKTHGSAIANLVDDLLKDPTAKPLLSLIAVDNDLIIGHILFSKVDIINAEELVSASILAPLAVLPVFQNQGIGGLLIKEGLKILSLAGVALVFVLGHPEYYPRHGFKPAGALGFEACYPIPNENADAWMVNALKPDIIGNVTGKVICADTLNKPEHWRE